MIKLTSHDWHGGLQLATAGRPRIKKRVDGQQRSGSDLSDHRIIRTGPPPPRPPLCTVPGPALSLCGYSGPRGLKPPVGCGSVTTSVIRVGVNSLANLASKEK
eukprot:438148-Hanusia_phi.AAC.1